MVVAINIADYLKEGFYQIYLIDTFHKIAEVNPKDSFYFITEKEFTPTTSLSNINYLSINYSSKNNALTWLSYQVKVANVLKKYKPDIFISSYLISGRLLKTEQVLSFVSTDFISFPSFYSTDFVSFFKKQAAPFISKAKKILVASEYAGTEIEKNYKVEKNKIIALTAYENNTTDREQLKDQYADGNEYFYCRHTCTNTQSLINILKAFTLFKKRLKSSMKLIISTSNSTAERGIRKSLNSYKHKEDVQLMGEENAIMFGAYAMIYSSPFANFETIPVQVPILAVDLDSFHSLFGDAALYFKHDSPVEASVMMMLIYKDEKLRSDLINKRKLIQKKDTSASSLWNKLVSL
jgi:hypothetical protein